MCTKFLKQALSVIVLTATMALTAHAGVRTQGEKNLESLIKKNIVMAKKTVNHSGPAIVRVSFTVSKDGQIQITDYNSSNSALFDFVKKQLEKEKLYNADDLENKVFCYEFRFLSEVN